MLTEIVGEQIAELVDNAPQSFDTLKEIADWIDIHQDEFTELQTTIDNLPSLPETATVQETLEYLGSNMAIIPTPGIVPELYVAPRIVKTSSDTVAELEPNKLYVFPEMSALTITLATPSDATIANEYHFMFTSGATATTLTIPSTVSEPSGFTVEANMTYEVSIMENCMLVNSWAVSS